MTYHEFADIIRNQFLASFGTIPERDLKALWQADATVIEATEMVDRCWLRPDEFLPDRCRDLASVMPSFCE